MADEIKQVPAGPIYG